jgi:hypothetical protein
MSYTLIIGRDEDLCCRLVRESLLASGREVIYLPEDKLFPGLNLAWEFNGSRSEGRVGLPGRIAPMSEIDGVLARFYGIATSAEDFQSVDGQYLSSEWHALLRGCMRALACPVINQLRPELWYKTHLLVTDLIALVPGLRFNLPKTMITTRIEDAREFFRACGKHMRYSPLTLPSNYSIEREEDVHKLEAVSKLMPLFLSEFVSGAAITAFVVGSEVEFDPPVGSAAVADHCLEISAQLGLTFCAVQLIKSAHDEWYCLGVDAMPQLYECADAVRATVISRLTNALITGRELLE